MRKRIKEDLETLQSASDSNISKNPHYIERVENLLENLSKEDWIKTGQYHNAETYLKSFPNTRLFPEVNQLIRLAGGYVIQVLADKYVWKDCMSSQPREVMGCIWEKENNNNE
jgi:hypothetical protein